VFVTPRSSCSGEILELQYPFIHKYHTSLCTPPLTLHTNINTQPMPHRACLHLLCVPAVCGCVCVCLLCVVVCACASMCDATGMGASLASMLLLKDDKRLLLPASLVACCGAGYLFAGKRMDLP
jgi:hypothetical protein